MAPQERTPDHDALRELLAAVVLGAAMRDDDAVVREHLAGCPECAAESARLRETVRVLDGDTATGAGPGAGTAPGSGTDTSTGTEAGTGTAPGTGADARRDASGNGRSVSAPENLRARLLGRALRGRPSAVRTGAHAAPYAATVAGLDALLSELAPDDPRWRTDVVHDWDVQGTLAHLIAADESLAVRFGLGPQDPRTGERIPDQDWQEAWARRTAEVIAYETARDPADTTRAWRGQTRALLSTPQAAGRERATAPLTLMGLRLPAAEHFLIRAFETWVHTDDIGRALGLTVPPPLPLHLEQLVALAVRVLGTALGDSAPPALLTVLGAVEGTWVLGPDTEPVGAEIALDAVEFCLLVGGRRSAAEVAHGRNGDAAVAQRMLETAASLAWL